MNDGIRLVTTLARKFANCNLTEEDLFQEGMIALLKAQKTFRENGGAKFQTYAGTVIKNRFIDLQRKSGEAVSNLQEENTSGDFNLDDEVNLLEIKKVLHKQATDLERAIFNSYIEGFSYEEIGKIFELPRKKIDNTVQKVKRKIRENI
jgi:RNA polymerase sporulation-specific sigma factor